MLTKSVPMISEKHQDVEFTLPDLDPPSDLYEYFYDSKMSKFSMVQQRISMPPYLLKIESFWRDYFSGLIVERLPKGFLH